MFPERGTWAFFFVVDRDNQKNPVSMEQFDTDRWDWRAACTDQGFCRPPCETRPEKRNAPT